jgi:hypothetical protein
MADEPKTGMDWQNDELDLIVTDYFAMLTEELSGRPYVKSRHRAALMAQTGRTNGSVEFKFQNISAVLAELGMSWISGYKPRKNYQNAILDAIDRYLTNHPDILYSAPHLPVAHSTSEVFVSPPVLKEANPPIPQRLRQLIGKFDPIERDHRNRALGTAGESFVLDLERNRLTNGARPDLARRVRWVASEDGDGAGYDILSFNLGGQERLIEVKTTNGSALTPFFLSRNEYDLATERPAHWRIYRVHLFAREPRIFKLAPPLESVVRLATQTWRASFDS